VPDRVSRSKKGGARLIGKSSRIPNTRKTMTTPNHLASLGLFRTKESKQKPLRTKLRATEERMGSIFKIAAIRPVRKDRWLTNAITPIKLGTRAVKINIIRFNESSFTEIFINTP
jgi:hypothetical protein